jgi:Contractile injection system tube protein
MVEPRDLRSNKVMPKPAALTKAELIELDSSLNPVSGKPSVRVQFNPETLKVTYANQLSTEAKTSQTGTEALQHVGKGTTKLSVQLWFDVNHPSAAPENGSGPATHDVRDFTAQVAYFITPFKADSGAYVIPGIKFKWGSFEFVGVMESLDETLDLFSPDGVPLRATLAIGLVQQEIKAFGKNQGMRLPATSGTNEPAGTKALASAALGASVQSLADGASGGLNKNWQNVAAANGIENPRLLAPGQLIDINAKLRAEI